MTSEPTAPRRTGVVPRYARIDVIGGALMLFIAGLIWFGAIDLDTGSIVNIGPGVMPKALSAILFAGGAVVLLRGLFASDEETEPLVLALRPILIVAAAIVLFGLFVRGGDFGIVSTPRFGLMGVGPLTVFIAGFATPEAKPRELLVLAFGLTAAMLMVFSDLLGVPIPVFPYFIERAIPPSFGVDAAVRVVYVLYGVLAAALYVVFFGLRETRRG